MPNIIVEVDYVESCNCFLILSSNIYNSLGLSLTNCVKAIVVKTQNVIYLSAQENQKLPDGRVGLSTLYASALNLSPKDKLILSVVDSIPSLSRVTAHPVSEDDHQILEIASVEVEASLLNQLRIVWPNQFFPVWISPTVTVKLIVDDITPKFNLGRLEEHTELVIGDVNQSERVINPNYDDAKVTDDKHVKKQEESNNILFKSTICRLIPLKNESPPYLVTITPEECSEWLLKQEIGAVYELSGCIEPYSKVYVNVEIDNSSAPDIGFYKSLCVSNSVINQLNLSYGNTAILSPVTPHNSEITSVLITPCLRLKKKYPLNEIESIFRKKLFSLCLKYGRCLLNTKGILLLDNETSVTVTISPLDLKWGFVTLVSLHNLPISVNSLETNNSVDLENIYSCTDENNSDYCVGPTVSEMNTLIEHSLGLNIGIKKKRAINNNFLLVGKHGSGKTHLSEYLKKSFSKLPYFIHFETIDCTSLKAKRIETIGKLFNSHLNICKTKQPSVLLIENIETICGTFSPELEKSEASFHTQRISQKIADILNGVSNLSILIFATCEKITSINSALFKKRGNSVFSTIINIQPLVFEDRRELIKSTILNRTDNTEESFKDLDIDYYSSLTDSYVAADLIKFIDKAIFEAAQRVSYQERTILIKDDLKNAFDSCSTFMHNKLKVQKKPDINLSDVGGLNDVKKKLIEVIVWPSKYGALLNQCPLKKQNGVLIYGPPGSGKTMLAHAIAHESNLNFITVKGPEIMSKYIGESEEGVRRVFENALAAKPSLLFFDEFESLAPRRGEEQTGVTDRVVNQLLTALDGVEPISGVIVVAASSRPDLIDPALLRSGRLSHHIFCGYPNEEERVEILQKLSQSVDLSDDVNLEYISKLTENFSGADLKGLLTTAQIQVLDNLDDSENESKESILNNKSKIKISQSDLLLALKQSAPSLSNKDRQQFDNIYKLFSKGKILDVNKQRAIFA